MRSGVVSTVRRAKSPAVAGRSVSTATTSSSTAPDPSGACGPLRTGGLDPRASRSLRAGDVRAPCERGPGAPGGVPEVDPLGLRLPDEPFGEVDSLVDELRPDAGDALPHVEQDRPLGTRRDDRVGYTLDPDARAPTVPALAVAERLERVDLVRARVLAEPEEPHPRRVRHAVDYRGTASRFTRARAPTL